MEGFDQLQEYVSQRFDRLEGQHDKLSEQVRSLGNDLHLIDKRIDRIETKNTFVSAVVAFLVVNFQNVISFFKDKH